MAPCAAREGGVEDARIHRRRLPNPIFRVERLSRLIQNLVSHRGAETRS